MKISHLNNFNFFTPEIPSTPLNSLDRHLWRFGLKACLFLLTLTLLACGQESGTKGSYQADLVFPEDVPRLAETSKIDCAAARIANINFDFIVNGEQSQTYTFPCEKHNALIHDVPVGTGITVEVFADDSNGDALLEGTQLIDITKDKVNTGETIQMQYVPLVTNTDTVTGTDTDTETVTGTDTDTETVTGTDTDTETVTGTDTDTETDVEYFNGTWIITDSPEGCIWVSQFKYTSEIVQTGTSATITTTTDLWPNLEILAEDCTVSDNVLSCDSFEFTDDRGRLHHYFTYTLRYNVSEDTLTGGNSWSIYPTTGPTCSGSSEMRGIRAENVGETAE